MPELAEVECMRRRWDVGVGKDVDTIQVHRGARVFRGCDVGQLSRQLSGARLEASFRSGKRMLFRFSRGWLDLHLGMTGELRVEPAGFKTGRHEHLVLWQESQALVFIDPRMFGRVGFTCGDEPPAWWKTRPPEILDTRFTKARVREFLTRRSRAPIKSVLLMQERFPGIGNWMADEVLWRAGIDPRRAAGKLDETELTRLYRQLRHVCRVALKTVTIESDGLWGDPPKGWLFHVRWKPGGRCPETGADLHHAVVGGRTTCWSPRKQPWRG